MSIREKVGAVMKSVEDKFVSQFGFHVKEPSFSAIVDYMYKPKDSSSLAVTRILFGLCMLFDIPSERGGANMETRWGDPNICHFPLLPFLQAIPMPYMAIVYAGLWFGAIGMMLGYKYRICAITFTACYWYLFLIEKSYWNNHSYLFGLVALLLACTEANCYWSVDAYQDPSKLKTTVPYWNYFIIKYQFFILYFMAGLKKGTAEWLAGYSVQNLSEHWVFGPFKLFLTVPQIDYLIVHWFIFLFDLTVAMWMMYSKSRHLAMIICAIFHLMNSRLFRIGMFPWICLATMPLFYPFHWPKVMLQKFKLYIVNLKDLCSGTNSFFGNNDKSYECLLNEENKADEDCANNIKLVDKIFQGNLKKSLNSKDLKAITNSDKTEIHNAVDEVFDVKENFETAELKSENNAKEESYTKISKNWYRERRTVYLIILYVFTQAFLPYSHFITKGYNNWTNGLYGYSWDMMVHYWDSHAVIIKIVDNENQAEFYIDPFFHAPNDRWTRHSDIVYQYAKCLRQKLVEKVKTARQSRISQNISIYIDVWCSMNGRFTQRQFDSKADMLKVEWSPFKSPSYLMPLLDEALSWREKLVAIRNYVHSWNNNSDVVFLADFPGYDQEKYISTDLRNATLTILDGDVVYETQVSKYGHSYKLSTGEHIPVDTGTFHRVLNIGEKPAYYMYTFYNSTETVTKDPISTAKLPIFTELFNRLTQMSVFVEVMLKNLGKIVLMNVKLGRYLF